MLVSRAALAVGADDDELRAKLRRDVRQLVGAWLPSVVGLGLVASGAMTMTNKLVPLAMTMLVPLSLHVLFQLAYG